RADIERLKSRKDARSGHGPVAAAALRWGEPVLETRIATIGPEGPIYRGKNAIELVRTGARFEQVAELLWTGQWREPRAFRARTLGFSRDPLVAIISRPAPPLRVLALIVAALGAHDSPRLEARDDEATVGRSLVHRMACGLALAFDSRRLLSA